MTRWASYQSLPGKQLHKVLLTAHHSAPHTDTQLRCEYKGLSSSCHSSAG